MLPAETPWEYADLFAVARGRLLELLTGLRATDWERPSPCPGWTVLGLGCHLVGDDLGQLDGLRWAYPYRLAGAPAAHRIG